MKEAIAVGFLALALSAPSVARADLVQRGNLFVSFDGGIAPAALPRHAPAPIAVSIEGRVRVIADETPPALRRIVVELNRAGRLETEGLPVCPPERIRATTTSNALAACGSALVGRGTFAAASAFPEQSTFPSGGRILAFNSLSHGHPAILAHVYGSEPVAVSRLVTFHLRHLRHGPYGTVLTARLPSSLNPHGYIERVALRLHRTYRYRGARRSYLSAACAAPPGFSAAPFPFAHASMSFDDARTLSSVLTRSCKVRE